MHVMLFFLEVGGYLEAKVMTVPPSRHLYQVPVPGNAHLLADLHTSITL